LQDEGHWLLLATLKENDAPIAFGVPERFPHDKLARAA
jgi:hypothetical protein